MGIGSLLAYLTTPQGATIKLPFADLHEVPE
jgi:hypothetical protein